MNAMDISQNVGQSIENVLFKTATFQPWFWVVLSKNLQEVLDALHVLEVLANSLNSAPNAD